MTDILYRWPEAAKFGRRVPKEKFYEHGTVSTAVREKFINDVQRITWAYKLAEATINLPSTPAVPEIQVFTIDAKTDDVSEAVLGAVDKAIPFPIIFEIAHHRGEQPRHGPSRHTSSSAPGLPSSAPTTRPAGSQETRSGRPCRQRSRCPPSTQRSCSR